MANNDGSNDTKGAEVNYFHLDPLTYEGVLAATKQGVKDAKLALGISSFKGGDTGNVESEVNLDEADET